MTFAWSLHIKGDNPSPKEENCWKYRGDYILKATFEECISLSVSECCVMPREYFSYTISPKKERPLFSRYSFCGFCKAIKRYVRPVCVWKARTPRLYFLAWKLFLKLLHLDLERISLFMHQFWWQALMWYWVPIPKSPLRRVENDLE